METQILSLKEEILNIKFEGKSRSVDYSENNYFISKKYEDERIGLLKVNTID